jgi:hypothetical protein
MGSASATTVSPWRISRWATSISRSAELVRWIVL